MNISMKSPCATDIPRARTVFTFERNASSLAAMSAPAHVDASTYAGTRKAVRSQGTWQIDSGLGRPRVRLSYVVH